MTRKSRKAESSLISPCISQGSSVWRWIIRLGKLLLSIQVIFMLGGCFVISKFNQYAERMRLLTNDSIKYWSEPDANQHLISDKETGIVLFSTGAFLAYEKNIQNERKISSKGNSTFCAKDNFSVKFDSFIMKRCGTTIIFQIKKLTPDSLVLKELTNHQFRPDAIPIIYTRSKD